MIIRLAKYGDLHFKKGNTYQETDHHFNSWHAIKTINNFEFDIHFDEHSFFNELSGKIELDWSKIENILLRIDGNLHEFLERSYLELEKVHNIIFEKSLKAKKGYFLPNAIKLYKQKKKLNYFQNNEPDSTKFEFEFCFSLEHLKYENHLMDPYQLYYIRFDAKGNFIEGVRD